MPAENTFFETVGSPHTVFISAHVSLHTVMWSLNLCIFSQLYLTVTFELSTKTLL